MSLVLVAFTLSGGSASSPALAASLAAITAASVAAALAARAAARVSLPATLRIGHRAQSHRESLSENPEPSHPDTAGRPRPRAPGAVA
jgi:hypothetical protein